MTDTNNTDGAALLPVTADGGPKITLEASCFGCPFVVSESYRVQSDSGSDVYCAHPSFEKRQRVGDTVWDTPDFCPVADIPALRDILAHQSSNAAERGGVDEQAKLSDWRSEVGHPNNRLLFKRMAEAAEVALGLDDIATALEKVAALASLSATPATAMDEIQRLGQEYDGAALGRFGHHPEPAIDFEHEVEQIESIVVDLEKGMRQGEPVPLDRIERAMTFRVGGDAGAVAAKATLRKLETRALALTPTPDRIGKDAVREALVKCRAQFAFYVASHGAKVPPDTAKAATNQSFVDMIDRALSAAPAQPVDETERLRANLQIMREALEAVDRHHRSSFFGSKAEANERASWRGAIRKVRAALREVEVSRG